MRNPISLPNSKSTQESLVHCSGSHPAQSLHDKNKEKGGKIGSPCLRPLELLKKPAGKPLMENDAVEIQVPHPPTHLKPKPVL